MSDLPDRPVDLSPLHADAALRASRIAARVAERVVERRRNLWHGVRTRLAPLAIPGVILAAASVALLMAIREPPPTPEPFAALLLDHGPVRGWVAFDQRPGIAELVATLGRVP